MDCLVHFFSDEVVVLEGFEEGERLVDGICDVLLHLNEVLEKNLLNTLYHNEHPGERGRLRRQRQRLFRVWRVVLVGMGT